MTLTDLKEEIADLLKEPLKEKGYEIAEIVLSKYKSKSTLKVFVYSQNGVTIDGCAYLSRFIGDIIEGTDLFESGYTLEVSSPGLERPLKTALDFQYRIGEKVKIEYIDDTMKKVTAEIKSANDDEVIFHNDNGDFTVALDKIKKAKIIF
ncbi:MAG: hypothetical protein GXO93_01705 [FCB group bacterium]|nr:hypothetical protein [FCB group bacterium]